MSGVICYVVTASQTVSDLLRDSKPKGKHLNLVSQFPRYWLAGWMDAAISTGRVYSSSIHTIPSKLLEHDTQVCVHIPLWMSAGALVHVRHDYWDRQSHCQSRVKKEISSTTQQTSHQRIRKKTTSLFRIA